jgi:hypothetical protein
MGVRFDEEGVVMSEGWRVGMGIVALLYACACEVVVAEFERSSKLPFFALPVILLPCKTVGIPPSTSSLQANCSMPYPSVTFLSNSDAGSQLRHQQYRKSPNRPTRSTDHWPLAVTNIYV